MKTRVHPLWLLASLALIPAAHAAEDGKTAADPQQVSADMKVAIDPATGKLRPLTRGESRALEAQANKTRKAEPMGADKKGFAMPATEAEALAMRRVLPNGATMLPVPESMMSALQINRDADGALHVHHEGEQSHAEAKKELPNE